MLIGLLMLGQWAFLIMTGKVPELRTEPVRIGFHIAAEFLTSVALIVAGVLLLVGAQSGVILGLVASGMLIYTVIVSPGYFAQRREWPLVVMFAVLLGLAIASVAVLWRILG